MDAPLYDAIFLSAATSPCSCADCSTRTVVRALSAIFTLYVIYTNDHLGPICIGHTGGCEMQQQAESGDNAAICTESV